MFHLQTIEPLMSIDLMAVKGSIHIYLINECTPALYTSSSEEKILFCFKNGFEERVTLVQILDRFRFVCI